MSDKIDYNFGQCEAFDATYSTCYLWNFACWVRSDKVVPYYIVRLKNESVFRVNIHAGATNTEDSIPFDNLEDAKTHFLLIHGDKIC